MATLAKTPRSTMITLASTSSGPFILTFRLFDADTIRVYRNGEVETGYTLDATFEDGYTDSASITLDVAGEPGDVIIIDSDLNPHRAQDYLRGDPNIVDKLNIELARIWAAIRDTRQKADRSLRSFQDEEPVSGEAGQVLMIGENGFDAGPTADEVSAAQGYAESAAESAATAALLAEALETAAYGESIPFSVVAAPQTIALPTGTIVDSVFISGLAQQRGASWTQSGSILWLNEPGAIGMYGWYRYRIVAGEFAGQSNTFNGRIAAVPAANGAAWPVGSVISDGTVEYRYVGAPVVDITDMPGWVPHGDDTPEHHGAGGRGITDDTAAMAAWGGKSGRGVLIGTYMITGEVNIARDRVDAGASRIVYDGAGYGRMIELTTPNSRWIGGEIDGNLRAAVGIYSEAGGCIVSDAEIHGMRSVTGQCAGVWFVGAGGGTARRNEIYDLSALGDGVGGDGNGPSRAVVMTSTTALTTPYVIEDNEARNIVGEEGDVFQILVFGGSLPFLSAKWSIIRNNRATAFNRRGVKIQASDVICEGNILIATGASAGIGPESVIDVIASNNVIIRRNFTEASAGMRAILVSQSMAPDRLTGIIVEDNIHNGVSDADSIALSGVEQSVARDNIHMQGRCAIYVVNSQRTVISDNIAAKSVSDGVYADFEIGPSNSRMLVDGNVALGGTKYAAVGAKSPISIFRNTVSLRDTGAVVVAASTATDSMIADTVGATSSGIIVSAITETATKVTRTSQLGNFSGALSCDNFWVSSIPTTSRAGRYHTRGDVAWNGGTGPEIGWRCTTTGTPGTWAAF